MPEIKFVMEVIVEIDLGVFPKLHADELRFSLKKKSKNQELRSIFTDFNRH